MKKPVVHVMLVYQENWLLEKIVKSLVFGWEEMSNAVLEMSVETTCLPSRLVRIVQDSFQVHPLSSICTVCSIYRGDTSTSDSRNLGTM